MITCPECSQELLRGTLFCPHCGTPLQAAADTAKTGSVPFTERASRVTAPPLVGTATRPTEGVAGIRFIIPASGRRITLPLQDQIQIGRLDLQRGIQPDLDVSADSDPTAGVSRLHASIVRTPQGIAIMDLHSANGTRVNGFHIPPDLPYALNSGDELKLGDLLIHVLFEG